MNKIPCQQQNCEKDGCSSCYGYGVVLTQSQLGCGCLAWVRPGVFTIYEGKTWTTFDGVHVTYKDGKEICSRCLKKP